METLANIWERGALNWPDELAYVFESESATYAALFERALRLGASLRAAGVAKHSRIAILSMNRAEYFEYYAACHLASLIATPLNFRHAAPELVSTMLDNLPSVLIFEDQYADMIAAIRSDIPFVEQFICLGKDPSWATPYEAWMAKGDPSSLTSRPAPDDCAHLLYTSGSTGKPKGVMKSHRADLARARKLAFIGGVTCGTKILLMMPLCHAGAHGEALAQHLVGGTVILHRKFDARACLRTIEADRVEFTHMAPTMIGSLLQELETTPADLSSLRYFTYSAGPMPSTLIRDAIQRMGPIFANNYGSTETGASATLHPLQHMHHGQVAKRLGSIGQEIPGTTIRIVDENGVDCAPGVVGELVLKGDSLFSGYWNKSSETLAAFQDGWYLTGDMGYMDAHRFIFLVDRKKDMVISGGENIYCREIEECLLVSDSIDAAAVIGIPDQKWGEVVKAYIVKARDAEISEQHVIVHCAKHIARYKLPRVIEFVDALPLLVSGKVDKVELRRRQREVRTVSTSN
jgi:acyl-CoA synthetase (AMP-forming)/AMP-acid ligase II